MRGWEGDSAATHFVMQRDSPWLEVDAEEIKRALREQGPARQGAASDGLAPVLASLNATSRFEDLISFDFAPFEQAIEAVVAELRRTPHVSAAGKALLKLGNELYRKAEELQKYIKDCRRTLWASCKWKLLDLVVCGLEANEVTKGGQAAMWTNAKELTVQLIIGWATLWALHVKAPVAGDAPGEFPSTFFVSFSGAFGRGGSGGQLGGFFYPLPKNIFGGEGGFDGGLHLHRL
jgi:hypothetical protein